MILPWTHAAPTPFSDHTYKVAHGVQLDLRIFPADVTSPSPFVLYVHGGAFVAGKHYVPNVWVIPALRPKGFHVVSISYRFAPHVGLEEMLEDGLEAYAWAREHLPTILGKEKVDVERYVIIGESAGGTLATLLSHHLSPQPKAVVDIYGVVDWLDPAFDPSTKPTPTDIQPLSGEWSEEQVRQGSLDRDPSNALTVCPYQFDVPVETYRDLWAVPEYEYTEKQRFQWEVKKYLRTHKGLPKTILRYEECQRETERINRARAFSSLWLLDDKGTYPPTAFLHGTDDKVVNISHAHRMAKRLKEMGIEVVESYEPNQGHEFDNKYTGPDVEGWDTYIVPIINLLEKHASRQ